MGTDSVGRPPALIISLDCEGLWGLADQLGGWTEAITRESLTWAYTAILRALETHGLKATFAYVALFATPEDEVREHLRTLLEVDTHREWITPVAAAFADRGASGWLLPESLGWIQASGTHEVASHGYSHLPVLGTDNPDKAWDVEVAGIDDWGRANARSIESYVYPRNEVVLPKDPAQVSWNGYRQDRLPKGGMARLMHELSVWERSQSIEPPRGGLVPIPGGMFMNWRHGRGRVIPLTATRTRWRSILRHAGQGEDRVAHLWLHPHNLITGHRQLDLLDGLLRDAARYTESGRIENITQGEYCERVLLG